MHYSWCVELVQLPYGKQFKIYAKNITKVAILFNPGIHLKEVKDRTKIPMYAKIPISFYANKNLKLIMSLSIGGWQTNYTILM